MVDARERFIASSREQWEAIVNACCDGAQAERFAEDTGASSQTLKRKFAAVKFKVEQGWAREAIIAAGQRDTLTSYAAAIKRAVSEPKENLSWRVSKGLAEAVQRDIVDRAIDVLGITTHEELWQYIHASWVNTPDKFLRHEAGMPKLKKK